MTVSIGKKLLKVVEDTCRHKLRGQSRAQFIRDAVFEKLQRMGIELPQEDAAPPARFAPEAVRLNEKHDEAKPVIDLKTKSVVYARKRAPRKGET